MREIKLLIQKEKDLVLLMQGIKWIRQHSIEGTKRLFDVMEKVKPEQRKAYQSTIDEKVETYDRLMSLLAQLDNLLEKDVKFKV